MTFYEVLSLIRTIARKSGGEDVRGAVERLAASTVAPLSSLATAAIQRGVLADAPFSHLKKAATSYCELLNQYFPVEPRDAIRVRIDAKGAISDLVERVARVSKAVERPLVAEHFDAPQVRGLANGSVEIVMSVGAGLAYFVYLLRAAVVLRTDKILGDQEVARAKVLGAKADEIEELTKFKTQLIKRHVRQLAKDAPVDPEAAAVDNETIQRRERAIRLLAEEIGSGMQFFLGPDARSQLHKLGQAEDLPVERLLQGAVPTQPLLGAGEGDDE